MLRASWWRAIVLAALMAGCATDAHQAAQLAVGMTREQVEHLRGSPARVQSSGAYTALQYGTDYHVVLRNDRVVAFGTGTVSRYPGTHRFFIEQSDP